MDNTMDRLMTAAVLTWTVLFSLLLPLTAHAQDDDDSAAFVPTTSEEVEEVVESQLRDRGTEVVTTDYAAFPDLYDDVFVASDTVIVTGQIQDHLFAAAGDVKVSGTVGADIFVAAGDVLITGQVAGDVFAAAGNLVIAEGASVGGKVMGGVGTVLIDGAVAGDVSVGAGEMTITGKVGGDIDAEVGRLVIEDGAQIGGKLSYVSQAMAEIDDGAQIGGSVDFEESVPKVADDDDSAAIAAFFRTWGAGASMVLGALLLWVGGPWTRKAMDEARDETAHRLGLGFGVALAAPALAGVLGMFILPLPVSFLLLTLLCIGMWFGRVVAAGALGSFLLRKAGQEEPNRYLALLTGLAILWLVAFVPVLGFLAGAAATFVGLGALYATAREARAAG